MSACLLARQVMPPVELALPLCEVELRGSNPYSRMDYVGSE